MLNRTMSSVFRKRLKPSLLKNNLLCYRQILENEKKINWQQPPGRHHFEWNIHTTTHKKAHQIDQLEPARGIQEDIELPWINNVQYDGYAHSLQSPHVLSGMDAFLQQSGDEDSGDRIHINFHPDYVNQQKYHNH